MLKTYSAGLLPIKKELPLIIDLFSGCGGLSYGFRSAGFQIGAGIDSSSSAVETASYNLSWRLGEQSHHICGDVTQSDVSLLNPPQHENGYIVIGGPPCQAYSQAGKGKLRSLGAGREHINDPRGKLYNDFLRIALEIDARVVVMENVPEATNYGGLNIPEHVCDILEQNGYVAKWSILNAADYGVPQIRERMFVIAVKRSGGAEPSFPKPTHRCIDERNTAYKQKSQKHLLNKHFVPAPEPEEDCLPWVTVYDALSDLPSLHPSAESRYRLFEPNTLLAYSSPPLNDYQKLMREWTGYSSNLVSGHGYRRTIRDFPIFEKMKPDDNFLAASEIAEQLLKEACEQEGITPEVNPEKYEKLRKKIVPPYDREKFHDKWKRLNPNKPSHTLVAHLSVDTYSHIHPWEPRGISVREAARLQSFPDDFLFQCPMSEAFKQIGNAVPPLLSYAIASHIEKILQS